ncbi:coiled-coil domain-containing protein 82 [Crotalus adamanteus]|uniref:Coiled-coil domain-containing protein 82 n=1 Tax=Crotalus adamanteus TaxID=8729 RepID=A0AAW1BKI2_CROAD
MRSETCVRQSFPGSAFGESDFKNQFDLGVKAPARNQEKKILMETNPLRKGYKTRSMTEESVAKSHVDCRRTKRYIFPEHQDDDNEITSSSLSTSSSSSSEEEENPKSSLKEDVDGKEEETSILSKRNSEAGSDADFQKGGSEVSSEDLEEGNISFGKRKRPWAAMIYDSDQSSDSDVPRKVIAKGRNLISKDDLSVDGESPTTPAEKAANKKREIHIKLQKLSFPQSRKSGKVNQLDEGSVDDDLVQHDAHSPFTEEDDVSNKDSMKVFISDDEEEEEEEEKEEEREWGNFEEEEPQHQNRQHCRASNLLEKHVPFVPLVDHYLHFQRVIKAFLINATDDTFLSSLYEGKRQNRFAQDLRTSLYYLDHHFIQPRLESLVSGCCWKERYKTRVDGYSDVRIISEPSERRICQACELDRDCNFIVVFSGKQYIPKTLTVDDFLSHNTQRLKVDVVCQKRTQVYHDLKHYKYKLYQKCCSAIKEEYRQDEPAKELVKRVFSQLNEDNWICKEYSVLDRYLDKVAEFHKFYEDFKRNILSFVLGAVTFRSGRPRKRKLPCNDAAPALGVSLPFVSRMGTFWPQRLKPETGAKGKAGPAAGLQGRRRGGGVEPTTAWELVPKKKKKKKKNPERKRERSARDLRSGRDETSLGRSAREAESWQFVSFRIAFGNRFPDAEGALFSPSSFGRGGREEKQAGGSWTRIGGVRTTDGVEKRWRERAEQFNPWSVSPPLFPPPSDLRIPRATFLPPRVLLLLAFFFFRALPFFGDAAARPLAASLLHSWGYGDPGYYDPH